MVRSMNLAMAFDTLQLGSESAVLGAVQWRDAVALETQRASLLGKQPFVARSVGIVALGAAAAFNGK